MLSILLQTAAIAGTAGFFLYAWTSMHRRSAQTWDDLVARLQPGWDESVEPLDGDATPEERWEHLNGAAGLYAMFKNAKVMLEMADYAARYSDRLNAEVIATLRSDVLHIRVLVAAALTQYAFRQLNEGIVTNAQRAADMYRQMLESTAEMLQASLAIPAPQYMGAR